MKTVLKYFKSLHHVLFSQQQKLKEETEALRALLDSRHQFMFGAIASKLGLEENEVEDFILDEAQVCIFYNSTQKINYINF